MTPVPLAQTDVNTKRLISLFLVTMLVAIFVAELNVYDKVGRLRNGVALRYGPERPITPGASANQGELPMENTPEVERLNTFTALLDITHAHIFELPLVVFVLAHFVMRARVPDWLKLSLYVGSFGSIAAFLGAPWIVRYLWIAGGTGLLYLGSGGLAITCLAMIGIPLVDMWR